MRSITAIASCALLALPLVSLSAPARADNNDFMGQAKKFLNNDNNTDRNAYERGRQDELRRQQAEQDRTRYRPDRDSDRSRDDRYRNPNDRDYDR
ncbi:MAG TPA: hypothetical protein VIY55_11650 [Acetobacteraceae bacterium]|jgi:hypothetical protein